MPSVDAGNSRTVLFLDDEGWDSFEQMAIALRRRGFRTVRVSNTPPARLQRLLKEPHFRWIADRLAYDERVDLGAPHGCTRLQELLDRGEVADVVANEPALLRIGLESPLGRSLTERSLAFRGTPPQILLDKFAVNEALARAGIETPRQIRVADLTPAEAVAHLGLPLWIKAPIGASREQVRVAGDVGEIAPHLQALRADEVPLFYQEHVDGALVIYGAVLGAHGALAEALLQVEAANVRLDDDPALLAAGRRAANLFRPRGFASFAFIRTVDGRRVHIAANLRPWGTIAAPVRHGVDFAEADAALLRNAEPIAQPAPMASVAALPVFPQRLFAPAEAGRFTEVLSGAASLIESCGPTLGLPYCGYLLARTTLLAARGWKDRRTGRIAANAPAGAQAGPRGEAASSTPA